MQVAPNSSTSCRTASVAVDDATRCPCLWYAAQVEEIVFETSAIAELGLLAPLQHHLTPPTTSLPGLATAPATTGPQCPDSTHCSHGTQRLGSDSITADDITAEGDIASRTTSRNAESSAGAVGHTEPRENRPGQTQGAGALCTESEGSIHGGGAAGSGGVVSMRQVESHGDCVLELPPGAVRLAKSGGCGCQARWSSQATSMCEHQHAQKRLQCRGMLPST